MGSDISRITFDPTKHYSGVRLQQGRVLLDADWNEQAAIRQYREQTQTKDVVGPCGVQKESGAFRITAAENGQLFAISPGRIYVQGMLCELEPGEVPTTYMDQPYLPEPGLEYLQEDTSGESEDPAVSLQIGRYLVYLDAWQREISYIEDPGLLEVALNGADTTTRLQQVWQVKLLQLAEDEDIGPENFLADKFSTPDGELTARLDPDADPRALGNQLYRVEIHRSGNRETASFKWSRENASIEIRIAGINDRTLYVQDPEYNKILNFSAGDWVEIVTEAADLQGKTHALRRISAVNPASGEIVLTEAPDLNEEVSGILKLRRWDQQEEDAAEGLSLSNGLIALESGIQVAFSEGQYRLGDYWLIPSRNASASIAWPAHPTTGNPAQLPPHGVPHYYCKLAVVEVGEDGAVFEDCRPLFPSLTNMEATDVGFDSQLWETEAETVQQALDELCETATTGSCTFVVVPGPGWEQVFDLIPEGGDARICFQVGTYPLDSRIELPAKGNILMTGCGYGSRIVVDNDATAIYFNAWENVVIRDLAFEAKVVDPTNPDGVLTFFQCGTIRLQNIQVKCAGGTSNGMFKSSSCVSVYSCNAVQILDSSFLVGYLQFGLNIMQPGGLLIENNVFEAYHNEDLLIGDLVQEDELLFRFSKFLISEPSISVPPNNANVFPGTDEYLKLSLHTSSIFNIYFKSHQILKDSWSRLIQDRLSTNTRLQDDQQLEAFLAPLVKAIWQSASVRARYAGFGKFYETVNQQRTLLGDTAILVYEPSAISGRFHMLNNTVNDFQTGIYVANNLRNMDKMLISGNYIRILQSPLIENEYKSGIRLDHPQDLLMENNNILINRLPGQLNQSMDGFEGSNFVRDYGVRISGLLGQRIVLQHNQINSIDGQNFNSFVTGLYFRSSGDLPQYYQWAVTRNILMGIIGNYSVQNEAVYLADNIPDHSDNV